MLENVCMQDQPLMQESLFAKTQRRRNEAATKPQRSRSEAAAKAHTGPERNQSETEAKKKRNISLRLEGFTPRPQSHNEASV